LLDESIRDLRAAFDFDDLRQQTPLAALISRFASAFF
jgi:hypothetical protein